MDHPTTEVGGERDRRPTALQQIVGTPKQAEKMIDDLMEAASRDGIHEHQIQLVLTDADVPQIINELEEIVDE